MTDKELKALMQQAGMLNGNGPFLAGGDLNNFHRLVDLIAAKILEQSKRGDIIP